MDNAQKAIMIGVGLFITIIIISAVLLIVNLGTGLMDDAGEEIAGINAQLREEVVNQYAGKLLDVSSVTGAVRKYANEMAIVVYDGGKATSNASVGGKNTLTVSSDFAKGGVFASNVGTATSVDLSEILSKLDKDRYYSALVMKDDGTVVGIAFCEEEFVK